MSKLKDAQVFLISRELIESLSRKLFYNYIFYAIHMIVVIKIKK